MRHMIVFSVIQCSFRIACFQKHITKEEEEESKEVGRKDEGG